MLSHTELRPRRPRSLDAVTILALTAALLLGPVGCSDDASTTSSVPPADATTLAGAPQQPATTGATTNSSTTTVAPTSTTAAATSTTIAPMTTSSVSLSTTSSALTTTTTTKPAVNSTSTTTTRPASTTTTAAPTTTTAAPTTTTTAGIPPLPDGAELQVITPDGRVVPFTLDQLADLPLARMTLESKIQEGPLLIDVLHAAGVQTFSTVVLTGSRGPVFVNTASADQVDGTFLLDFTNHGSVKVASPVFGLEDRNAKDIYLIQVF